MLNKIKYIFYSYLVLSVLLISSCKKIPADLNVNPNVPSTVDPKFSLSSALTASADIIAGNPGGGSVTGNQLMNAWMGYCTVSGDYIPVSNILRYTITTDYGSSIWNSSYIQLENFKKIQDFYAGDANGKGARYTAMARIMKAMLFQRLVDVYNNIPYSDALDGGVNNYPKYDNGQDVYNKLVAELNASVALINSAATATADDPGRFDVMYKGDMTKWKRLANTIKLKILMHQSTMPSRAAYITGELVGMSSADFIGSNSDAAIQPGYSNDADNKQNPLWNDIGFTTSGGPQGNNEYFRANDYGVKFYKTNNDPRLTYFYAPSAFNGQVVGREYGSINGQEKNEKISAIGGNRTNQIQTFGTLKSPAQDAIVLTSSESLFLQTEAMERGFLSGSANSTYAQAVIESFRVLGVPNASTVANNYIGGASSNVNLLTSTNRIRTIILQKWAALNTYDALESWSDWRRLGIPSDLPVSIYPGTTAPHIPYRMLYPSSEFSSNTANVTAQGSIDPINSKLFWMP